MADKMSIITKITPEVREKVAAGIETLFKIGAQFPTSGQLVDSFVTNNGLSEPTSIVNINNMGSPGTLVYGGSEESNGSPYHFIVLASKLFLVAKGQEDLVIMLRILVILLRMIILLAELLVIKLFLHVGGNLVLMFLRVLLRVKLFL